MLNIDNITRLRINEGTMEHPFILTDEEVKTLVKLADMGSDKVDIRGVVNTDTELISGYQNYILTKAFPNLRILATVVKDTNWQVSLLPVAVGEGKTVKINARNIEVSTLKCEIGEVALNVTYGTYTVAALKKSMVIDMEKGEITAPADPFNTGWVATIPLKFYPKYIENPEDDDCQFVTLTVNAVPVTDMRMEVAEAVEIGGTMTINVTALPLNNTKQASTEIAFTCNEGSVRTVGGVHTYYAPNRECEEYISASALVNGVNAADASASLMVSNPFIKLEITSDNPDFDSEGLEVTLMRDGEQYKLSNGQKMNVAGNGSETFAISMPSVYGYKLSVPSSVTPQGVKTIITAYYEEIVPDVYLVYKDGSKESYGTVEARNFNTKPETTREDVVGVGLIDIECSFIIAPNDEYQDGQFGTKSISSTALKRFEEESQAYFDFDGEYNTAQLKKEIESVGGTSPIIDYCYSHEITIKGEKKRGYVCAAGQLRALHLNLPKFDKLLKDVLKSNAVYSGISQNDYTERTSTLHIKYYTWHGNYNFNGNLSFGRGDFGSKYLLVRPFYNF